MQIGLNRVRVPGNPAKNEPAIVDIDVQEEGRLDCLRRGECYFGVGYRPRFSCDPSGVPANRASLFDNVYWEVVTEGGISPGGGKVATFTLQDPDGDGEYEWVKVGKGPFHGGNHALGQRTHGNDIVLVVTEGGGETYTVQCFRDGVGSNILGPYKLAPNR